MRLNDWSKTFDGFVAPESMVQYIQGTVEQHPQLPSGSRIAVSGILKWENDRLITINGDKWEIENPLPDYEKMFPNARNRLIKVLNG